MAEDYESMTVAQLKELLKEQDLPVSGKKSDLMPVCKKQLATTMLSKTRRPLRPLRTTTGTTRTGTTRTTMSTWSSKSPC